MQACEFKREVDKVHLLRRPNPELRHGEVLGTMTALLFLGKPDYDAVKTVVVLPSGVSVNMLSSCMFWFLLFLWFERWTGGAIVVLFCNHAAASSELSCSYLERFTVLALCAELALRPEVDCCSTHFAPLLERLSC